MEAWIEMVLFRSPSYQVLVASFVEAWIEILPVCPLGSGLFVASFVEAWIEILLKSAAKNAVKSPPSWRRGLK